MKMEPSQSNADILKSLSEQAEIIELLLKQNRRLIDLAAQFCNMEEEERKLEELAGNMQNRSGPY